MGFFEFLEYCFYCMMQFIFTLSCDSWEELFIGLSGWIVVFLFIILTWKLIKFFVTRHAVKKYLKEQEKSKTEVKEKSQDFSKGEDEK